MYLFKDKEEQKTMIDEMRDIVEKNCFVIAKLDKANEVIERITQLHSSNDSNLKFEEILKVNISLINDSLMMEQLTETVGKIFF